MPENQVNVLLDNAVTRLLNAKRNKIIRGIEANKPTYPKRESYINDITADDLDEIKLFLNEHSGTKFVKEVLFKVSDTYKETYDGILEQRKQIAEDIEASPALIALEAEFATLQARLATNPENAPEILRELIAELEEG